MLDDFKTELRRLGINRMRKDEERRQSVAMVLEEDDKNDQSELEFADALDIGPERTRTNSDAYRTQSSTISNPRDSTKELLGKSGKKISHLPSLSMFKVDAIKPGKKSRTKAIDEEK